MLKKWWKECVIYQIYPRSFKDSNHDGIGDIRGIIEQLDYLKWLGVGGIWLNPIYASPNDDMGYDISNYEAIMTEFGTMEDFDELLTKAHEKNIRIIMDLVVNHSSDEHQWFIESRSSKDNPYRDYYIWREGKNGNESKDSNEGKDGKDGKDGKEGKEPNNWASFFTPSAWNYDELTGEYYLHLFSEKQPDLNWENEKLRNEIYSMINRWFDKGVDGFRMDVINLVAKKEGLPDGSGDKSSSGYVFSPEHFANQPLFDIYMKEMREKCFEGRDCMCVGETPFMDAVKGSQLISPEEKELDMIFQFELMDVDSGKSGKWEIVPYTMEKFRDILVRWQKATESGWGSLFWSNHDQPRPVSRFGKYTSEERRERLAKMLGAAMHLMKGTSFIYQGEEIGMTNVPFESMDEIMDLESINFYNESLKNGTSEYAWKTILLKGRDNARTPMQWNNNAYAGFSDTLPWIKVNPNYPDINVEKAKEDQDSILHFYKKLIHFKARNEIAVYGDFVPEICKDDDIFSYKRLLDGNGFLVICNFSAVEVKMDLLKYKDNPLIFTNVNKNELKFNQMLPYEVKVIEL